MHKQNLFACIGNDADLNCFPIINGSVNLCELAQWCICYGITVIRFVIELSRNRIN